MAEYGEDYFERGPQTGQSLYQDYRWLPERTLQYVHRWARWVRAEKGATVLDFGCAKGYYVHAFNLLDFDAWGYDQSEYALANAHAETKSMGRLSSDYPHNQRFRFCHAKDVLEHVPYGRIHGLCGLLATNCLELNVIVPLGEEGEYYIAEMERDPTHIIREPLDWWVEMLKESGWRECLEARSQGDLKPHWGEHANGHGFIRMGV